MERAAEEEEAACDEEADPVEALKREKRRTKALAARIERLEAIALDAAGVAGKCGRQLLGERWLCGLCGLCVWLCALTVRLLCASVRLLCAALSARIGGAKNPKARLSIELATALETLARRRPPTTPPARKPGEDERGGFTKRPRPSEGGTDTPGSARVKRPAHFKCVDPDCKLLDEKPISVTAQPCGLLCFFLFGALHACMIYLVAYVLYAQVIPNASAVLAGSTISSRRWTRTTRTATANSEHPQQ